MKRTAAYVTSDGEIHLNESKAKRHAENRYGDAVTALAHKMVHAADKYTRAIDFIEANIDAFVELKALSDDRKIEGDDDEPSILEMR